jgi:3-hydroxybutyryl-CoA dehydrogenase
MQIKKVGIIGAGTMGEGIAYVTARSGYITVLYDIDASKIEKARKNIQSIIDKGRQTGKLSESEEKTILENLSYSETINDLKADLVIEAIIEKLEIKRTLFKNLEEVVSKDAILASNTSSIPITQIGATLTHQGRFAGLHFFNPAHIMKLVEIISGEATEIKTAEILKDFILSLQKVPVFAKDSPGFIVNRVARHYYVESLKLLEEGIATFEEIDTLLESSGFKMGPFKLMDLIGMDTNYSVTSSMFESFGQDPKFRPSRIQKQKVDAGFLGKKSGRGFYNY